MSTIGIKSLRPLESSNDFRFSFVYRNETSCLKLWYIVIEVFITGVSPRCPEAGLLLLYQMWGKRHFVIQSNPHIRILTHFCLYIAHHLILPPSQFQPKGETFEGPPCRSLQEFGTPATLPHLFRVNLVLNISDSKMA